jgi:hypothetical protein
VHFHANAVDACSRENPLGDASVAVDEVPRISPMGIGERLEDLCEPRPHGFSPRVACAADAGACGRVEDAVLRHERHEGIDVMAIPRVGEGLQDRRRDCLSRWAHESSLIRGLKPTHPIRMTEGNAFIELRRPVPAAAFQKLRARLCRLRAESCRERCDDTAAAAVRFHVEPLGLRTEQPQNMS